MIFFVYNTIFCSDPDSRNTEHQKYHTVDIKFKVISNLAAIFLHKQVHIK